MPRATTCRHPRCLAPPPSDCSARSVCRKREIPHLGALTDGPDPICLPQSSHRSLQRHWRYAYLRRKHCHRLARLAAQRVEEALAQRRQLRPSAPLASSTRNTRSRWPHRWRRYARARPSKRTLDCCLRCLSHRRHVLSHHLLDSRLQLCRRVRHARPNRTLTTSASTPPLNGYHVPGVAGELAARIGRIGTGRRDMRCAAEVVVLVARD